MVIKVNPKKFPVLASKPLEQWHRDMWEWIAKHPTMTKNDYVNLTFLDNEIKLLVSFRNCFACMFANRRNSYSEEAYSESCDYCPICNFGSYGLNCCHGLYDIYRTAFLDEDYEKASLVATMIANLEWRVK